VLCHRQGTGGAVWFAHAAVNSPSEVVMWNFEPEIPESILTHKPLYRLVQIVDASHVRVGFKANKEDPWSLSKLFDVTTQGNSSADLCFPFIAALLCTCATV